MLMNRVVVNNQSRPLSNRMLNCASVTALERRVKVRVVSTLVHDLLDHEAVGSEVVGDLQVVT